MDKVPDGDTVRGGGLWVTRVVGGGDVHVSICVHVCKISVCLYSCINCKSVFSYWLCVCV